MNAPFSLARSFYESIHLPSSFSPCHFVFTLPLVFSLIYLLNPVGKFIFKYIVVYTLSLFNPTHLFLLLFPSFSFFLLFSFSFQCCRYEEPEWREDEFTEQGKWMDGWESRRKYVAAHVIPFCNSLTLSLLLSFSLDNTLEYIN